MTAAATQAATATTKTCGRCRQDKPFTAFNKEASKPDGYQAYCRDCKREKKEEWQKTNGDHARQYDRERGSARGRYVELEHSAIVPSLTNPRKHFDEAFIAELAESIKEQGLGQPILVRPLPGSRVQETYTDRRADAPRPTHEIVAGEQRWRAIARAGLRRVPAFVREMDDAAVLQMQLVENLKRRDLHAMEEAEGYEKLRESTGMSAKDIGKSIGKGRTYVYKTMQLLQLLGPAREAFYAGQLTRSTAELLATLSHSIQLQALKDLTAGDFHGEPMSYRKAKAHIDERYMLKLDAAPFALDDETLVLDAGSCAACPKRTGVNPELFEEGTRADLCTDPVCFAAKKDAHYARVHAAAEARGQAVITGREAKEIMPEDGKLRGYTRLDDADALGGGLRTLRDVLGPDMPKPVLLENPRTREMIEVLPTATVGQLIKDHGIATQAPAPAAPKAAGKKPAPEKDEATLKREGIEQLERIWRTQAIEKVWAASRALGAGEGVSAPVLRLIALMALEGLPVAQLRHAAGLLKLGDVAARNGLEEHIRTADEADIEATLFLLVMERDMRSLLQDGNRPSDAPHIAALASDFMVDLPTLQAAAKKAMRDALTSQRVDEAAQAVKAQLKQSAKAPPARKPKTTQTEAASGIASGLQAIENPNAFAAGQRVRIKVDLRKGQDVLHTAGTEGELMEPVGDRAWWVQPDQLSFKVSADYTELEATEE